MKSRLNSVLKPAVASVLLLGLFVSCETEKTGNLDRSASLLREGYGVGSSYLWVEDIDSTLKHYKEVLGFEVPATAKSDAPGVPGAWGASISFPDFSSLELLALNDSVPEGSRDSRLLGARNPRYGPLMFSLSSSQLDSTSNWLIGQGFDLDSVLNYRVPNPRAQRSSWSVKETKVSRLRFHSREKNLKGILPNIEYAVGFPYELMTQWETFYVYQREFIKHPNGTVGLAGVQLLVDDLESARRQFAKMGLLQLEEASSRSRARFRVKRRQEIRLLQPEPSDSAQAHLLRENGPGVYGLILEVKNLDSTITYLSGTLPEGAILRDTLTNRITIPREYGQGIQLTFVQEPEEQALRMAQLQLNFGSRLDSTASAHAAGIYQKYCALCHGENREGYAADHAPSLRSKSLMSTATPSNFLRYTVQYGRENTAMAGYYEEQGGPLSYIEIELLLKWLEEQSGVEEPIRLSREPVRGDVALGAQLYANKCASCHGAEGQGISAPALGHPMLLATATDEFLKYAIVNGRDGTPMVGFKDSLSDREVEAVTAFLRSRASGWNKPSKDTIRVPAPDEYVLNPAGDDPKFQLREGLYLPAAQLHQAMKDKRRMVILDARSEVAWRQTHIPGAVPVPYYDDPDTFVQHIPGDSTWIVAYCACPHAASGQVVSMLRELGYSNTAIMDEGILVWAQQGYPVRSGN